MLSVSRFSRLRSVKNISGVTTFQVVPIFVVIALVVLVVTYNLVGQAATQLTDDFILTDSDVAQTSIQDKAHESNKVDFFVNLTPQGKSKLEAWIQTHSKKQASVAFEGTPIGELDITDGMDHGTLKFSIPAKSAITAKFVIHR